MKIIAYTALHYGSCYLASAIRSVIDAVDEFHVLYSATGSHGHRTDAVCPDTRDQLLSIAEGAAAGKLRWWDGSWGWEGQQRDSIHSIVPDADGVLVVDADEVWSAGAVESALAAIDDGFARTYRVPMTHYWRSFWRGFAHDPAYPTRVICPQRPTREAYLACVSEAPCRIHHFGYAQRAEIIRYKLLTHGHRNEFRRDVDWFNDVFMTNRQVDCHPVGSQFWDCEQLNPFEDGLPSWMGEHPYAHLDVIP